MSEVIKTAPETGISDEAATATETAIDLTAYVGRYVHLYSLADDLLFAPDADGAGTLVVGDAATATALVPDAVPMGAAGASFLVEASLPWVIVLAVAVDPARFRIVPTSAKINSVSSILGV